MVLWRTLKVYHFYYKVSWDQCDVCSAISKSFKWNLKRFSYDIMPFLTTKVDDVKKNVLCLRCNKKPSFVDLIGLIYIPSSQELTDHGRCGPRSHGAVARSGVAGRCSWTHSRDRPTEIQWFGETHTGALRYQLPERVRATAAQHVRTEAKTHAEQISGGPSVYAGLVLYALWKRWPEHPAPEEHYGKARGTGSQQSQHNTKFSSRRWGLILMCSLL